MGAQLVGVVGVDARDLLGAVVVAAAAARLSPRRPGLLGRMARYSALCSL